MLDTCPIGGPYIHVSTYIHTFIEQLWMPFSILEFNWNFKATISILTKIWNICQKSLIFPFQMEFKAHKQFIGLKFRLESMDST